MGELGYWVRETPEHYSYVLGCNKLLFREEKRTMLRIKRIENLAETAILVGEKPTEATVSGKTENTPITIPLKTRCTPTSESKGF